MMLVITRDMHLPIFTWDMNCCPNFSKRSIVIFVLSEFALLSHKPVYKMHVLIWSIACMYCCVSVSLFLVFDVFYMYSISICFKDFGVNIFFSLHWHFFSVGIWVDSQEAKMQMVTDYFNQSQVSNFTVLMLNIF